MKKHLLSLFAALLPLVASAQKVEIDGIWYNLVSKVKQAEVTSSGGTKYSGSITIPATVTYDGVAYSVTSIGEYAFKACKSLTAITISEGVTSIGQYAFSECSSLTAITIPEGVTSIGRSAFYYCSSLTDITIPEGVTSIESATFSNCSNLSSIAIPNSMKEIRYAAFFNCRNLTAVHINSIEDWCKISFDELREGNGKPANPLSYAQNLYLNKELVTELIIPNGVTSISNLAFYNCKSITSITIPESMISIGNSAFDGCSSLTAINIPESVTSIGGSAFYDCSNLNAVYIDNIKNWCKISFANLHSNPVYYAHNLYLNKKLVENLIIPEDVSSIGSHTFQGCESLIYITLPESITSIGSSVFDGCSNLTAINIPEGVTEISEFTFAGCKSLTTINLPKSIESIGREAFSNCGNLSFIVLPKSLHNIGYKAFANCSELTDVYCYAEMVPSTYSNAFNGSYIEYATLHVPASAIDDYKSSSPWSDFGNIVSLDAAITRITLSESSATLTEGETLVLTMTTTPEDADRNLITWSSSDPSVATVDNTGKVTAIAPGTTTITAMANDGSGVSAQCEVTVNELILGTCATPTINYKDGKVVFACDTEGAIVKSNFKDNNASDYADSEVSFIPTYTLTAYATKENYEDSDVATLTLCWVPCKENHGDDNGIVTIPAKPVLIQCNAGTITLSGLTEGTEIAVYTTAGTEVATATATNGTATLTTGLEAGSIAIVKIGNYNIKVAIK